ncbi:membrane protein [Frankia sp. R43]|uniref:MMPL family transporter n=1 Tax=Frankia sp. R43 TaxID=269536 RepID=UPI0006CA0D05|nr:MMPL family transporter [Frankia sp. R43]KPM53014.1 membrane protein [Frankia sp. R43]
MIRPRRAAARSTRLFPWLIVACWLLAGIAISPLAFKLTEAQTNNASAFLPKDAESTRLLEAQKKLPGGDSVPAVVVLHRDTTLTDQDLAAADALRTELRGFATTQLPAVIPSGDRRAALITVPMPQDKDADRFTANVQKMREIAERTAAGNPGLTIAVTGPAGLLADTYDVFSKIEDALLLVTASIVAVILLVVYRSPFLWIVPLLSVGIADQMAAGLIYLLAKHADLTVNGQSSGMLRVLVFGAGTDYALLLIARYREELTRYAEPAAAMRIALHRAGPAILASAGTVIIGMLCLLLGTLNSHRGLGPVCALGILVAVVTMLTLLPAAMVVGGRRLFWPFVPELGKPEHIEQIERTGFWARTGAAIARHPRRIWLATAAVLGALVIGMSVLPGVLRQDQAFRNEVESVKGQHLAEQSFPPGVTAPTFVVANAAHADEVAAAVRATPGVVGATESGRTSELVQFLVVLDSPPDSTDSFHSVEALRTAVHAVPGADALVGGNTAVNLDVRDAAIRDRGVIIPVVLLVVLLILGLLLRAIVAPVLLMATVVLSFFAALGASALAFRYLFHFPGIDPALPLVGFIFLVALGVDYNIFLMTRVREEAGQIGHAAGVRRGLAVTGGVITSAGVVLAATFAVLMIFPLVQLAAVGFLVSFGVLLDTLVVRSVLVPALALDVGPAVWWPSHPALAAAPRAAGDVHPAPTGSVAVDDMLTEVHLLAHDSPRHDAVQGDDLQHDDLQGDHVQGGDLQHDHLQGDHVQGDDLQSDHRHHNAPAPPEHGRRRSQDGAPARTGRDD